MIFSRSGILWKIFSAVGPPSRKYLEKQHSWPPCSYSSILPISDLVNTSTPRENFQRKTAGYRGILFFTPVSYCVGAVYLRKPCLTAPRLGKVASLQDQTAIKKSYCLPSISDFAKQSDRTAVFLYVDILPSNRAIEHRNWIRCRVSRLSLRTPR